MLEDNSSFSSFFLFGGNKMKGINVVDVGNNPEETMKGITVVDVGNNPEQTTFGTCEICLSYGVADNPYIVLKLPDGTTHKVNTFMWDWGDYNEYCVDNVVDFSAWLSEQEFTDADIELIKSGCATPLLCELIDNYNWSKE